MGQAAMTATRGGESPQDRITSVLAQESPLLVAEVLRVMTTISQVLGEPAPAAATEATESADWISVEAFKAKYDLSPAHITNLKNTGAIRTAPKFNNSRLYLIYEPSYTAFLEENAQGGPRSMRIAAPHTQPHTKKRK